MPTKNFLKFCRSSLSENLLSNEDVLIPQRQKKKKKKVLLVYLFIYIHHQILTK